MSEQNKQIGRYEIIRELGGGGMGRVFLAHDPRFPRDVALKLLHANLADKPSLRQRFRREARTVAALEHHAIVPVYDYGEHDDQLFLVMRLMRGGTLQERLRKGPLSGNEAVAILTRIAAALDKAHEQGIIHRDLKPANVLFDDEGKAYLSDFGIVKRTDGATLTATHSVIGTPQYMSPEQALGEADIDFRSDIYALGALAYEMLSGDPPYVADTQMRVMLMHVREPVPSLHARRPDLPAVVDAILAQAMAKEPRDRFASAGAFVSAFSQALSSAPSGSTAGAATIVDRAPLAPDHTPRKNRPYGRYVAVGLLLVAAVAALAFLRPDAQEPPAVAAEHTATPTPTIMLTATLTGTPTASLTPTSTATATSPTPTATAQSPASSSPVPSPESPTPPPVYTGLDDLDMRLVPAGTFLMGSNEQFVQNAVRMCRESGGNDPCVYSEFSNELPEHAVDVDAFYIDITEVTNAHYRACVDAGDCAAPSNRQYFNAPQYDTFPVVYVSWYDARQYCLSVGERLPTEAEWEKASRGNDTRLFPWGHVWDPARTNSEEQGGNRLRPVGQFPSGASPFGVLDLSGNVWEWVSDWYDPLYYQNSPVENPQGPPEGSDKVLRGGGFSNFVHYVRTTNRGFEPPASSSTYRGFRCAVSASQANN